jgi:isopenicillin-N N-acyltransferase-like protein
LVDLGLPTDMSLTYSNKKGISDGAGLPFVDVLILNIRTEIAFGMFNDGCTSLYWKTSRDSFLAQNWDVSLV